MRPFYWNYTEEYQNNYGFVVVHFIKAYNNNYFLACKIPISHHLLSTSSVLCIFFNPNLVTINYILYLKQSHYVLKDLLDYHVSINYTTNFNISTQASLWCSPFGSSRHYLCMISHNAEVKGIPYRNLLPQLFWTMLVFLE